MQTSWIFFVVLVILAWLANCCYYVAVWRLSNRGISVNFLAFPTDIVRALVKYQSLASENSWSMWPVYGFWLSSIPTLCGAAIWAVYANLGRGSGMGLETWPSVVAALAWCSVSSLLIAVLFSYRVVRYLSIRNIKLSEWKRWYSNKYALNDSALAIIGWIGFVAALFKLFVLGVETKTF
jgi:hypothetical protein